MSPRPSLLAKQEIAMAKKKLVPATVRLKPELWNRIERLAEEDRRPVGQYLRNVILDHVKAAAEQKPRVAA
jgi:hypothetical protein